MWVHTHWSHVAGLHLQMEWGSSVRLLGDLVMRRHKVPEWLPSFLCRAFFLTVSVLLFMVLRVYLMKEGPNIFTE